MLAALDDDARDRVRFVLAVGGYYGLEAVVTYFTTGWFRPTPGAAWAWRRPNAYGKWVFVKANADRLDDAADRALLAAMAERKLRDVRADVADLAARLGPEGRRVHALLENTDPDRAGRLIAGLPKAMRDDLAALDLSRRDLSGLAARLYLVHGRNDAIIPAAESRALAAALAPGRATLTIVDSLAHADLGPMGLFDMLALWDTKYDLLGERERMTPPAIRAPEGRDLTCPPTPSGV